VQQIHVHHHRDYEVPPHRTPKKAPLLVDQDPEHHVGHRDYETKNHPSKKLSATVGQASEQLRRDYEVLPQHAPSFGDQARPSPSVEPPVLLRYSLDEIAGSGGLGPERGIDAIVKPVPRISWDGPAGSPFDHPGRGGPSPGDTRHTAMREAVVDKPPPRVNGSPFRSMKSGRE